MNVAQASTRAAAASWAVGVKTCYSGHDTRWKPQLARNSQQTTTAEDNLWQSSTVNFVPACSITQKLPVKDQAASTDLPLLKSSDAVPCSVLRCGILVAL